MKEYIIKIQIELVDEKELKTAVDLINCTLSDEMGIKSWFEIESEEI